jgi:hypothetical protein
MLPVSDVQWGVSLRPRSLCTPADDCSCVTWASSCGCPLHHSLAGGASNCSSSVTRCILVFLLWLLSTSRWLCSCSVSSRLAEPPRGPAVLLATRLQLCRGTTIRCGRPGLGASRPCTGLPLLLLTGVFVSALIIPVLGNMGLFAVCFPVIAKFVVEPTLSLPCCLDPTLNEGKPVISM